MSSNYTFSFLSFVFFFTDNQLFIKMLNFCYPYK